MVFWHPSCQFAVPCLILDSGGVDCQRIKMLILSYGFRRLGAQDYYYSFYGIVLYFDVELDRTWLQWTAVKWKKQLHFYFWVPKNNTRRMSVMTECTFLVELLLSNYRRDRSGENEKTDEIRETRPLAQLLLAGVWPRR